MIKKTTIAIAALLSINAHASTSLVDTYNQALTSDPIYQQAIYQRLSTQENAPISLAGLLPNANFQITPSVSKVINTGSTALVEPRHDTVHAYQMALTLNQTIFDFGKWAGLSGARALSHEADATLNVATQGLMLRVANAYFNVLKDEDNLTYNKANKEAFAKQLDQVTQQYKVGLKTVTDVYTAQASFDTASAGYIAAQTLLADDKENLRAITGNDYPSISTLSENFPLISPAPADMEAWVRTAVQQNWAIKSAEYASQSARAAIRQQFAGNLPTLNSQASYTVNYARDTANSFISPGGAGRTKSLGASLSLNVPILEGGLVVSSTQQARYNYEVANQVLEQNVRQTTSTTRQSYLGIMAGIQQIRADKQAIKSTISSLEGMNEGYRVGTQTLVDVLNQQQKVFQAETTYATDRYSYVINLLTLKQAAGTLSADDLSAINAWLLDRSQAHLVEARTVALNHPIKLHHSVKSSIHTALLKHKRHRI